MHLVLTQFLFSVGLQTENFLWTPEYPGKDGKVRVSSRCNLHTKQSLQTVHTANRFFLWLGAHDTKQCNSQTCSCAAPKSSESRKCRISSINGRQEHKQTGEAASYKKADLTFTVCLRCFSFSVCRSLRVRNPFATAVILSNFICISGLKTLKKNSKLFIKKPKNYDFFYQITSIKWHKFSSKTKPVDNALAGLKVPNIIWQKQYIAIWLFCIYE